MEFLQAKKLIYAFALRMLSTERTEQLHKVSMILASTHAWNKRNSCWFCMSFMNEPEKTDPLNVAVGCL